MSDNVQLSQTQDINNIKPNQTRSKFGSAQELEKLLQLAEQMQLSQEESANKIYSYRLAVVVILIGFIFSIGIVLIQSVLNITSYILLISFTIGFLSSILITERNIRLMRRRQNNDRRILAEITALLREIEPHLAIEHQWSRLEKEQFRIRLSRFDIN